MNKKILVLITGIISVLLLYSLVFAAKPIAVTIKSKGKVDVYQSGKTSNTDLKKGARLNDGDKIVTGTKSYAAVRFIDDGSLVRVRANSSCTIKGKEENNEILKNVYLEVGTVFAKISKQKGKFQVTTPTSVASVKGTQFISDHRGAKGTYYFGEEGTVEVSNDAGSALLKPGETAFVANSKTAPVVRKTVEGEKPGFDEDYGSEDEFEFEFENEAGEKKLLKFKAKKKE